MDAMDVDMDVDVDFVPNEPVLQAQDTPSPGEVVDAGNPSKDTTQELQPNKVHIRGLDVMNPTEVKAYVAEHYPNSRVAKIEWIDDTSANLVFDSETAAHEALVALSAIQIEDATQLPVLEPLQAKSFSSKPGVSFHVRLAVVSDKKEAGAAQKSRFYLLNPEYDPENRTRRDNRRYRDRDGQGYETRRRRSREEEPVDEFDVNLYDDDAGALATRAEESEPRPRRRRSLTPNGGHDERSWPHRDENRNKELFPDLGGRGSASGQRNRSASPARERDGDVDMDYSTRRGESTRRNRRGARAIRDRLSHNDSPKELFPSGKASAGGRLDDVLELSDKFTLQDKDLLAEVPASRKLEDRISRPGGPPTLADRITVPTNGSPGLAVLGTASSRSQDQGFSIKGASKTARELFPDKLGGNAGKELFADKLDGRSRRRQRAGDLFD